MLHGGQEAEERGEVFPVGLGRSFLNFEPSEEGDEGPMRSEWGGSGDIGASSNTLGREEKGGV